MSILVTIFCDTRQEAARSFTIVQKGAVCKALRLHEAAVVDNCIPCNATVHDAFVTETANGNESQTLPAELLGLLIALMYDGLHASAILDRTYESLLSILTDLGISNHFIQTVSASRHAIFLLTESRCSADGEAILHTLGDEVHSVPLAPRAEQSLRQLLYR